MINQIITSLLDNDLYKFTMMNAVMKKFPREKVQYTFINRGKTDFPDGFAKELKNQINKMSNLELHTDEKNFLAVQCRYFDPAYLDFLEGYRYNPNEVSVFQSGGQLNVSVQGYWYRTILWEVPLLAIISELYYRMTNQYTEIFSRHLLDRFDKKTEQLESIGSPFADFGTRRRHSIQNHIQTIDKLEPIPNFVGTSNVYLAKVYNLKAIGTQAHEWFMFHAEKFGYKMANELALENWVDVYQGDLGIALSDTFTSDVFFRSFGKKYAKLFDGIRHDSGDPFNFADKTINHYKKLGIDPNDKTIVFSDSLTPTKVDQITNYCQGKIKTSYGIGTNLTNDVPGIEPLNIVIKMTGVLEGNNIKPTIKLSDDKGKYTGDPNEIKIAKSILNL